MNPEDRVLVGVINRKRDLNYLLDEHWYRIPQKQMPEGVCIEYLAFFLSGSVFKEKSGGIHYYSRIEGTELVYRRDLLPGQDNHARSNEKYFRVAVGEIKVKKTYSLMIAYSHRLLLLQYLDFLMTCQAGLIPYLLILQIVTIIRFRRIHFQLQMLSIGNLVNI